VILITLAILLLALLFTGVGLLFPARLYQNNPGLDTLFASFWAGWAMVIGFLQLWNLVFPIQCVSFYLLIIASAAGWFFSRAGVKKHISSWNLRQVLLLAGVSLILALVLANHVMYVPYDFNVDHGLYHMQSVKWAKQYAIVPGLGNLHYRLAFNNSNFLYSAMLDWGILDGRSYYVSGTLLAYMLVLTCAAGLYQLFQTITLARLYSALMIPISVEYASSSTLAGYSPDVPVFILGVVLGGELINLYESTADANTYRRRACYITFLAAAGITVKLSFAVFGLLIVLAVLLLGVIRFKLPLKQHAVVWLEWAGGAAILAVPWLIRGAILSGYLLFPNPRLPLPVPWKIPTQFVEPIQPIITLWARTASKQIQYTGDLQWFLAWAKRTPFIVRQAFAFTLVITVVDLLLLLLLRRYKPQPPGGAAALYTISALSLGYWFVLAPNYRFSGAIFWTLLASAVLFGFQMLVAGKISDIPLRLAIAIVLATTLWLSPNHFSNNLSLKLLLAPPSEKILAENYQSSQYLRLGHTNSGLTVYLPPENECLDAPLPCAPASDFTKKLALFDPNDLQRGFYIQQEEVN